MVCKPFRRPRFEHPSIEDGETLMGLLVGLAVGLVVLAAGSALLANQLRAHRMALQDSRLHHDLRSAMDWMARELSQAHYVANAWETRAPSHCDDPFCAGPDDFNISGSRIAFSLDRNHNGLKDNNECLGFRLVKGALQARTACSPEVWTALTDTASLQFTQLDWQLQCGTAQGWLLRRINLALTAQWPGDTSRQVKLTRTVHLHNALPTSQTALFCP
jgi:type II secretory pathway component PulJ